MEKSHLLKFTVLLMIVSMLSGCLWVERDGFYRGGGHGGGGKSHGGDHGRH